MAAARRRQDSLSTATVAVRVCFFPLKFFSIVQGARMNLVIGE
jgi:hypothetical protein